MKKIIFSLMIIAAAAAVVIGGTSAYFSDEEKSEGNIFEAGSIDLVMTNEHSTSQGGLVDDVTDWLVFDDVDNRLFFDFEDLKPGDYGENTLGFMVEDNDAWLCANIVGSEDENGLVEPEEDLLDTIEEGELGDYLTFVWWVDDGDNDLEDGEIVLFDGPVTFDQMMSDNNNLDLTLADPLLNVFNYGSGEPIEGLEEYHIGVAWCLGDMTLTPGASEWLGCDGSENMNVAQTDKVEATVLFEAFQSRNNDTECPDTYRRLGRFPWEI